MAATACGGVATKNVCVFAEAEVDRSPTGSGVTARLAAMHAKGEIGDRRDTAVREHRRLALHRRGGAHRAGRAA